MSQSTHILTYLYLLDYNIRMQFCKNNVPVLKGNQIVYGLRMVDVFKTNVQGDGQARILVEMLLQHFPNTHINFDLEDCDKILRVKHDGNELILSIIPPLLHKHGFNCEELKD